jgi:hypothetical protein
MKNFSCSLTTRGNGLFFSQSSSSGIEKRNITLLLLRSNPGPFFFVTREAFKPPLARNASVPAWSLQVTAPPKFTRQSRHDTAQAAMDHGIFARFGFHAARIRAFCHCCRDPP